MFCPKCLDPKLAGTLRVINLYVPREGSWRVICCDRGHFFRIALQDLLLPYMYSVIASLHDDELATNHFRQQMVSSRIDVLAYFRELEAALGKWPTLEKFRAENKK